MMTKIVKWQLIIFVIIGVVAIVYVGATYAKLDGKLRPIYTKHGISLSYGTEPAPGPDHGTEDCTAPDPCFRAGGLTAGARRPGAGRSGRQNPAD